jgi:hypothetical protein
LLNRSEAQTDQRLFARFPPEPELTLHASMRVMLAEAMHLLGPDDVLVPDCRYPAVWLVAVSSFR